MNNITYNRKQRKSLLGTRRVSMQFFKPPSPEPEPEPKEVTEVFNDTIREEPDTTEKLSNETIKEEPEDDEDLIVKPTRKTIVCSLFANDSFEENETMLANCSGNETILASTLLMTAKKDNKTLEQILDVVKLLLKENSDAIEDNIQQREILKEMKRHVLEKR